MVAKWRFYKKAGSLDTFRATLQKQLARNLQGGPIVDGSKPENSWVRLASHFKSRKNEIAPYRTILIIVSILHTGNPNGVPY